MGEMRLQHRVEQRLLVGIVLLHRPYRDTGPFGDARRGKTPLADRQQNLNGRFENRRERRGRTRLPRRFSRL